MINIQKTILDFCLGTLISNEDGSTIIRNSLLLNKPLMVARFGSVEIKAVLYPRISFPLNYFIRKKIFKDMFINAGFFPVNNENIQRFSDLMIEDIKMLDILGSWRVEECLLAKSLSHTIKVDLKSLEPYYSTIPWTEALRNKRVLVVHPFNGTIEEQYFNNRRNIFANTNILPDFKSLVTIKAVQTIGGNKTEFNNWFQALESMKIKIEQTSFDVAIIGCGAYGFPLAAHVKRIGKKAIHLGGATQILFGIRGNRWDSHPLISKYINEYWVRPKLEDMPLGASSVENACYW